MVSKVTPLAGNVIPDPKQGPKPRRPRGPISGNVVPPNNPKPKAPKPPMSGNVVPKTEAKKFPFVPVALVLATLGIGTALFHRFRNHS